MDTIKISSLNKKMVAHRGVSGLEKENSLPAFIAAGNRSYFGVECDIHRTTDGKFVVIHDAETARVAGDNLNVEKSSFDLVRSVQLNDMDGEKRKDLFIPSLEEYVKICKKYQKKCVLEIKGLFEEEWIKEVIQIITDIGYLENVIFIAFDIQNLYIVRKLLPDQPAQFLTGEWSEELLRILGENKFALDIHFSQMNKERVDLLHANGIEVNCWTVDDKETAESLLEMGVDYITSNILE